VTGWSSTIRTRMGPAAGISVIGEYRLRDGL
jgi:hypothetical protein